MSEISYDDALEMAKAIMLDESITSVEERRQIISDLAEEHIAEGAHRHFYNTVLNDPEVIPVWQVISEHPGGGGLDNDQVRRDYNKYLEKEQQLDQLEQNGSVPPLSQDSITNSSTSTVNDSSTVFDSILGSEEGAQNIVSQSNDFSSLSDEDVIAQILDQKIEIAQTVSTLNLEEQFVLPDYLPETGTNGNLDWLDYAKFAKDAYQKKSAQSLPEGYQYNGEVHTDQGYSAAVYLNPDKKDIIIAYAGSDGLDDWLGIDANIASAALGTIHNQVDHALVTYNEIHSTYPDYSFTVTGHSLGGYLAETVAYQAGINAISFDPLYAGHLTGGYSNIWRVLPPDNGVYHLTQIISKMGYTDFANLAIRFNTSPLLLAAQLGLKVNSILKNHSLEYIIDNIFSKEVIVDTLNPITETVEQACNDYCKIWV